METNTFRPLLYSSAADDKYRGAPFWALNGALDEEEIREQIRGFKNCGMGGFFLHARTGLTTEYLSEKWFSCISAAIDEAEKKGMYAWLYDEDRYPSGSGGGFVTSDPRWQAKCIFLEQLSASEAAEKPLPENTVSAFAAVFEGEDTITSLRRLQLSGDISVAENEERIAFYTGNTIPCSWYNNFTYLDTINPDAVAEFIRITHEQYKKRYKDKFGKTIPGIFTDEPRYGFLLHLPEWENDTRNGIPWTPGLLEEFEEKFGFDLTEHLPEIFFDVKGIDSAAPRVKYIELLTQRLVNSFSRQIGSWCRENGLVLTGHVLLEDSLSSQTQSVGCAMRFYEYMDMPGIDVLTARHRAFAACKQLASAANQTGKKRRLSELYGCTGLNFPISGFKALGAWQYALGVNFRCQHLALYSTAGEAKRDYPAPVARHSLIPDAYKKMEDFFARLGFYLSQGREKQEILLLHPVESAWSFIRRNWRRHDSPAVAFDRNFNYLIQKLLANQLDFDLGEEDFLARNASVTTEGGKVRMQVGCASYSVIVLPSMVTIRSTTVKLLQDFIRLGGTVISAGNLPAYVDCVKNPAVGISTAKADNYDKLVNLLSPFRTVSLKTSDAPCPALLYQLREHGDCDIFYICNTGHPVDSPADTGDAFDEIPLEERTLTYDSVSVEIKTEKAGEIIEFDLDTGKYYTVAAEKTSTGWRFETSMDRLQARLFIAAPVRGLYPAAAMPAEKEFCNEITIPETAWRTELSEDNVMVLDTFSAPAEGEKSQYVLNLDDALRTGLGLPVRGGLMAQPWCRGRKITAEKEITVETAFICEELPEKDIFLVIERPDLYKLNINGTAAELLPCGFWHEKAWQKCAISRHLLQTGYNKILLTTACNDLHPGLESIFLTGVFGVKISDNVPVMTALKDTVTGAWQENGLPFFPASVSYTAEVELPAPAKGKILIENYSGTYAGILIDGKEAAEMLFSPAVTPLMDLPAKFTLTVKLAGSMRNTQGPFYLTEKNPVWCGPKQFKDFETAEKQFDEYGIFSPVKIIF